MTIGEKIKAAREAAHLTQTDLGRICGTTKQTIYKYEIGAACICFEMKFEERKGNREVLK